MLTDVLGRFIHQSPELPMNVRPSSFVIGNPWQPRVWVEPTLSPPAAYVKAKLDLYIDLEMRSPPTSKALNSGYLIRERRYQQI